MTESAVWHRPHPLSMVVNIAEYVRGQWITVVLILVVGRAASGFDPTFVAIGGIVVVVSAGTQWWATRYAVTDQAVELRSGVFKRQARAIPLDRIQQVAVAEPAVARVLGLASVQVSEASADGDVAVKFLGRADADSLTERLRSLARAREAPSRQMGDDGVTVPPPPAHLMHRGDLGDLVRYQLAVVAPVVASALVAAALAAVVVGAAADAVGAAAMVVVALVASGAVVVAWVGAGVLTLGGFELRRGERGLLVNRGLLSRRHLEVRPERTQTVTVRSGPVARRIGLHRVITRSP